MGRGGDGLEMAKRFGGEGSWPRSEPEPKGERRGGRQQQPGPQPAAHSAAEAEARCTFSRLERTGAHVAAPEAV